MAGTDNPNWCFVEDTDTQAAVIGLMRHHIPSWPAVAEGAPVHIKVDTKIKNLQPSALKTEFQASERKALGIVVDAETALASVWWNRISPFVRETFQSESDDLPSEGLVLPHENGRRFGIWVMPDNFSSGMLEDFLRRLIPDEANTIWQFATQCVGEARAKGAAYRDTHLAKANLHTYLAWEDPPGERLGPAIARKFLNPHAETARTFVGWFKRLYELG
jgi:hypothetical protein